MRHELPWLGLFSSVSLKKMAAIRMTAAGEVMQSLPYYFMVPLYGCGLPTTKAGDPCRAVISQRWQVAAKGWLVFAAFYAPMYRACSVRARLMSSVPCTSTRPSGKTTSVCGST